MKKNRVLKTLNLLDEYIMSVILLIIICILFLQVVFRYVFNNPLIWSEELARFLYIWIAFLGAGFGVRRMCHVRMEAIFQYIPKKAQKIIRIITNLLVIFCYGYIIPYGINFTIQQSSIASSAMGIPMGLVTGAAPVGCSLLIICLVIDTIKIIRNKEENINNGVNEIC